MDIDLSPLTENWRFLLGGLGITLALSLLTIVGSAVAGLALALGRLYGPRPLRWAIVFYIDSMRAVPVLVVLVWVYFAVPILTGITAPPFWAACVALVMQLSAYVAEAVRAGIESVRPGQVRAGLALGMSRAQILRTILLPQALVRMLPALGSLVSITIKDTAIATVIAVPELMKRAETVAGQSYRPIEVYTVVMLTYFLILFPSTRAVDALYKRVAHLGRS
ncbi:MAG: amino acid ABC transporter permease [Rubrivivax sp.]